MPELLPPERRRALVLGADASRNNIGDAIMVKINEDFEAHGNPCRSKEGTGYQLPDIHDFEGYDTLVVSLGRVLIEPFEQLTMSEMQDVYRACLLMPAEACRRFIRMTLAQDHLKTIVLIGSYAHNHPLSDSTPYCSAKAGLAMLGRGLAWEMTPKGYQVFTVHPHHVEGTAMTEEVRKGMMATKGLTEEEAAAYQEEQRRMPEPLTPAMVAEHVVSLLGYNIDLSGDQIELYGGAR